MCNKNKPPTAQEISNACESNKHNKQGKVGSAETSSCGLVKLKAYYEDRWKTPMAGATFNLFINDKKVLNKARLAEYDHPEWEPGTFVYEVPEQGQVNFVITSEFTEAEIKSLKASIRNELAPEITTLIQSMKPYQEAWAKNSTLSFLSSLKKGKDQADKDFKDSISDMFSVKMWKDLGKDISNLAGKARSAAEEQAGEMIIAALKTYKDIDENGLGDWVEKEAEEARQDILKKVDDLEKAFEETKEGLKDFAKDSKVILKHRKQILDLPSMILDGKVDDIESFLDTVVKKVEPDLYNEIRDSEQWQSTIELIYDGEAIGLPLYYLSEMLSAVPPNFYAEKFSYVGATLMIEVTLMIVLSLLGGAGAAARLATLIARISSIARKSKKGASALRAYVSMLKAFQKVIAKIKKTANKLTASRRASSTKGATSGTVRHPRKKDKKRKQCPNGTRFKQARLRYGKEEIIGG